MLRLWGLVKDWFQLVSLDVAVWASYSSIKDWWFDMVATQRIHGRAMSSLTMLVCKSIWDERNARVFRRNFAPPTILLRTIQKAAILWATAGAKHLGHILPG